MTRVVALAAAMVFLAATPGFAQAPPQAAPVSAKSRIDFSPRAAGIDTMSATQARRDDARRAPRAPQSQGRSFWKTPWPYVIIGGVVAAGIIIASGDGDGIY